MIDMAVFTMSNDLEELKQRCERPRQLRLTVAVSMLKNLIAEIEQRKGHNDEWRHVNAALHKRIECLEATLRIALSALENRKLAALTRAEVIIRKELAANVATDPRTVYRAIKHRWTQSTAPRKGRKV